MLVNGLFDAAFVITLFNEGKDIDYWSPSSFHNGPPTIKVIKRID